MLGNILWSTNNELLCSTLWATDRKKLGLMKELIWGLQMDPLTVQMMAIMWVRKKKLYLALMQVIDLDFWMGKSLVGFLIFQLVFLLTQNNYYCHNHLLPQNNSVGRNFFWPRLSWICIFIGSRLLLLQFLFFPFIDGVSSFFQILHATGVWLSQQSSPS